MSLSAIFPVVSSCYYLISTSKWKTGIIALETSVTFKIVAYLNQQPHPPIVLDDRIIWMDESAFVRSDWRESIYEDVEDEIPPKAPKPLGNPVTMTCFVDANHKGEQATRRSQTGAMIYLHDAPVDWYSKKTQWSCRLLAQNLSQ